MEFYVILKHEFITSDGHAKVIDKNRNLSPEKKVYSLEIDIAIKSDVL
jgi:hypothetical protein